MEIESTITRFIREELLRGDGQVSLEPSTSLIRTGILDSLALLKLIVFIEQQFGLKIEDGEVLPNNFETIDHIKTFIEGKRKKAAG